MKEDELIEEMAQEMKYISQDEKCKQHCIDCYGKYHECMFYSFAVDAIIVCDYRKQRDTAKKILQPLYDETRNSNGNRIMLTNNDIKNLAKKYCVEVEE